MTDEAVIMKAEMLAREAEFTFATEPFMYSARRILALEEEVMKLRDIATKGADTFHDLRVALDALGHPTAAHACRIGEEETRKALEE
jgi:hypothetical protein